LAEGTVVVGGSGDNQAGAIGAGVVRPGMILATLGTSGVIYAHADRPRKDLGSGGAAPGRVHTMCAATGPGGWCVTGCMLSAAGSLQWVRDTLFPAEEIDTLLCEAEGVPPGSGGLVFLPYLTGERCPHPDPDARGGWVGLTARHTRGHLVRAVLEGVAFGMAQIVDLQRSIGVEVASARVGGGGAKSALWRRMLADLIGVPVATTNTEEGPAYGAALLAGVAAGVWPGVAAACDGAVREVERIDPDPARTGAYAPVRAVYERLYSDLRERFGALAAADR
jgi:xylulokinase